MTVLDNMQPSVEEEADSLFNQYEINYGNTYLPVAIRAYVSDAIYYARKAGWNAAVLAINERERMLRMQE